MLLGRIAQTFATEKSSYYIYGAAERLYNACAAPADYTIDPKDRKAGKLQTTAEGEEIGVSKGGSWHNGTAHAHILSIPDATEY
jgi:cytochrome b pre-mRNA-processing protein 3